MTSPDSLTPFTTDNPGLLSEAGVVLAVADGLGSKLSEPTLRAVAELLTRINTYYSNLIEGHVTDPADVERALNGDYSSDPAKRDLQLEALAHIEVQKLIDERIAADPHINVCDPGFLRTLHKAFYDRLPESMHVVRSPDGRLEERVAGGGLRSFEVVVGRHHPLVATAYGQFHVAWHVVRRSIASVCKVQTPRAGMTTTAADRDRCVAWKVGSSSSSARGAERHSACVAGTCHRGPALHA
jgi:hypothetical protein